MSVAELLNQGVAAFGEFAKANPGLAVGVILTGAGAVKGGKLGAVSFVTGVYFILHNWGLDTALIDGLRAALGI